MRTFLIGLAAAGILAPLAQARAADGCQSLDWRKATLPTSKRALTARDLISLRDIGPTGDDNPPGHVMAISPDKKWVAFQLRQANADTNRYCLAIVVQSLDDSGEARFVDAGGDFMLAPAGVATMPATAIGIAAVVTPRWSPDGRWLAFLKRLDGIDRVWRVDMTTGRSIPITPKGLDITDFRIVDPGRIVVQTSSLPARPDDEGRTGFHYDERFIPMQASVPIIARSETRYAVIDISTGVQRAVTKPEIALFDPRPGFNVSMSGRACVLSRTIRGSGVLAPTQIEMNCRGAPPVICRAEACENSYGPLWIARKKVRFLRRDGWAGMTAAIYQWAPAMGRPQRLYATDAMLADCQPRGPDELICLRETSLHPRQLVSLDLAHRHAREIADPNPEFERLNLGTVERIKLTSSLGLPAFADIVLPTHYRPGRHYPLIVVQYQSRGFLRGGTGDEFPIQLLANNGFVVLSVQRPAPAGNIGGATDAIDLDRRSLIGFADRRNVLSVIENGVDELIARGIVEAGSVGITGLSDGSSTVQFAALNSSKFAAGIVSGCCWEPGQTAVLGPAAASRYAKIGWPGVSSKAPEFWHQISLEENARRVAFPLLFEAADTEFRAALESFTALREVDKPADLFVYPNEFHIKWQPAHRLASYERCLDWFNFWLRNIWPQDSRRNAEVQRWARMRLSQ